MPADSSMLKAAIAQIAAIEGIYMPAEVLTEDVVLLAAVWPDEEDFAQAVASTVRALEQTAAGRVTPSPLENDLEGWFSHHYQLRRSQGERAVMRIVFQPFEKGARVKGFGHRFKPADIYHRMVSNRYQEQTAQSTEALGKLN